MTNNEVVKELTQIFSALNEGRRVEEACEIQQQLALFLSLDWYPIIRKDIKFDVCLYFIVMSESLMMNLGQLKKAQWYVALFNRLAQGHLVRKDFADIHGFNDIVLDFRLGNRSAALKKIDNWLKKPITAEVRIRLLHKKGVIENALQGGKGRINTLSEALACAEESDNKLEVARIYQEMAAMFGGDYPALGMSMLRKAEVIYRRLGRKEDYIGVRLYRTRSCIAVMNNYLGKRKYLERFEEEANAIIDKINEEDLSNKHLVAYYNWTKGMIKMQLEPIDQSLAYFIEAGAPGEICQIALHAVWISLQNGKKQKAAEYLELYKKHAVRIDDGLYVKRMETYELKKREIEYGLEKETKRAH